jgi:hypothetical protein
MCGNIQERTENVDDAHSGLQSIVTCFGINEQVYESIWDNRRINSDEIASKISVSHEKIWCKNSLRPRQTFPYRNQQNVDSWNKCIEKKTKHSDYIKT